LFSGSLRAFDETVRTGSIRKASEVLGVAPSSVSRHIAILEAQIGTALFHRRTGGLEITHAGQLVADYARSVLIGYDTLKGDLDDIRGGQRRLLKLAVVESVAHFGPVAALKKFRDVYPTVSFDIRLMPAPQIVEAVRGGQFDIGVAFCVESVQDIITLASVPEPIVLVVRADQQFAGAARVELHEIASLPLALPGADFGVRQIFDRASAAAGLQLQPVLSSNVFETLRDFVRLGAGAAVLPMRAVAQREGAEDLRIVPLAGAAFRDATIDIIVLRKRRLPRVVKSFVERLIHEIAAPRASADLK
jgi:DNA-binding transcriptional LysR family regulator